MAANYTPEEIQAIFDEYHDALARGIPITKELAESLADAKKGVKNYTYNLNQSLKQLGQTTKKTIGDIANGAKGVSVFNDAIDAGADSVSKFAMGFGPVGVAIGLVVKALSFFVQTANKQSDKLFETFQSLSRSGAVGAQGMTDVFQSMKRFGYTIDELDKMVAVLAENSKELAMFGGTVASGGKQVENLVAGFQNVRVNLQALGLSTDEQVRAAAGYYKQMNRLGRATDATSSGAIAYIKEMETLTRLTGQQRKELEDQREAAEDIDTFYAALMDMDPNAAKEAYATFNKLMAVDPSGKKARAFANSINGIIGGSEDQMQALFSTNFQLLDFATAVKEGRMSSTEFMQATSDATRQNIGLQKELAKVGVTDLMGGLKNNVLLANKGLKPFSQQTAEASGQVEDLFNATDAATKGQAQARVAQIDAANNMQNFINLGVAPATSAMATLAKVVENLTSMLPGAKPTTGYGQGGTGTMGKSVGSMAAGAATGAAIGSVVPGIGTAIGAAVGAAAGYLGYEAMGGGALTGKPTEGLDESFLKKLRGAANEYQQATGQAVEIVSAKRDSAKQAQLYADYQSGKSKFPAAPPGKSKHEQGNAVDLTLETANKLDSMGLLQKYGLSRPVANDPIHIEGAGGFNGMLSGPMSGYSPNLLMHGSEEISVRPMGVGSTSPSASATEGTMTKVVEKLDDLIYISKNQLSVNEKILKYQN